MTNLERMEQEVRDRKDLHALAQSPEGKALSARLDASALRSALQNGDAAALQEIARRVLSTPEGRALAEKVQKAAGKP